MAKIYFISDLHFGHKDVIAFDRRPFKDVEEMEAELIRKWNAKVSRDDHVFVIGDMFGGVTTAHAGEIVQSLKGCCCVQRDSSAGTRCEAKSHHAAQTPPIFQRT